MPGFCHGRVQALSVPDIASLCIWILQDPQSGSGRDTSLPQAEEHTPPASHQQVTQPKPTTHDHAIGTQQAAPTVTHKQMQDSGYGEAFARIMEGIPDHIKQHESTETADSGPLTSSDDSHSQPESVVADDARSSEVGAAVAAAMDEVAKQQQQQQAQAASLVGGAAYPDHVAKVCHKVLGLYAPKTSTDAPPWCHDLLQQP